MTDVEAKNKTIITRVRKPTAKNTPQEETPSENAKTQAHCPIRENLRMYLEQTVRQITSTPEQIQVSYWVGPNTTVYNINVPQESIGQLLGSKGKNITILGKILLEYFPKQRPRLFFRPSRSLTQCLRLCHLEDLRHHLHQMDVWLKLSNLSAQSLTMVVRLEPINS